MTLAARGQWFLQNFKILMSGDENLRLVYEENVFSKNWAFFLHFWPLTFQELFIVPKSWKLFFFSYGEWGIKQICYLILNQEYFIYILYIWFMCAQKVLAKKVVFQLKIYLGPRKIRFMGKIFSQRSNVHIFKISMKRRRVFDTPFYLLKEKMFSYHSRVNVHFLLTKYSKIEATTQYFKK